MILPDGNVAARSRPLYDDGVITQSSCIRRKKKTNVLSGPSAQNAQGSIRGERAEPASHVATRSGSERNGKRFWSKLSKARGSRAWLRLWWFGHQRLQGLHQFRQPVLLGYDRIEHLRCRGHTGFPPHPVAVGNNYALPLPVCATSLRRESSRWFA